MSSVSLHAAPTGSEFVMFRRVANILALGAAAGELGQALQRELGPDRAAVNAALDFKDNVQFQIVIKETGTITAEDVVQKSPQQWDTIHSMFLTEAENVYFQIEPVAKGSKGMDVGKSYAAFKQSIDEGRRLELALI